ncbi:MAG: phenolic acid decarboxylase [Candidatus Malihini olakiniferum]
MNTLDKHDLSDFVGKHLVYTYDNSWNYEIYVKNDHTLDHRIHSGIVANRWVKDQFAHIVRIAQSVYKISWTEPTGTDVSLIVNLGRSLVPRNHLLPALGHQQSTKNVCFQNDHISTMEAYRATGPAYPMEVIDEFVTTTFVRDCSPDNESVIAYPASECPLTFLKT